MNHEDFEQVPAYVTIDGETTEVWVSLCTCGQAFWDEDSGRAYDKWADHEANA